MTVKVDKKFEDFHEANYTIAVPLRFDEDLKKYAKKFNITSSRVIQYAIDKAIKDIRTGRYVH